MGPQLSCGWTRPCQALAPCFNSVQATTGQLRTHSLHSFGFLVFLEMYQGFCPCRFAVLGFLSLMNVPRILAWECDIEWMSQRFWHGNGIFNECLKDSVALIWFSTTQLIYPIILYHRKSAKCNVRVQESVAGIRLDRKVQSAKCNFRRVLHTSPPDLTRATLSRKRTLHFALSQSTSDARHTLPKTHSALCTCPIRPTRT